MRFGVPVLAGLGVLRGGGGLGGGPRDSRAHCLPKVFKWSHVGGIHRGVSSTLGPLRRDSLQPVHSAASTVAHSRHVTGSATGALRRPTLALRAFDRSLRIKSSLGGLLPLAFRSLLLTVYDLC